MDDRALLITADDALLGDLQRIAAAAGVEVEHSADASERARWISAPVVLLDAAQLWGAVQAGLPRRSGVVVVVVGEPPDQMWELCVRLGVERTVAFGGAASEQLLIELLSDALAGGSGRGRCLVVLGACGGAGASVFAAALALAAARTGADSLLVDADPWGAGSDVLLGIEGAPGLRWADLAAASGRLPADALQRALPSVGAGRGRVAVLSFGRTPPATIESSTMDAVLASGRRVGRTTVVDLPRHPGPAADRALERADLAVVVTPADVRGCWAAERVRTRILEVGCRAGVVVRGPSPGGLGAGDLAGVLQLPLLARMRADPALPRDLEIGLALVAGPGRPLSRAAGRVLAAVDRSS
ncbi:septum site-determining protein Ssd [Nakamurella sp. GG22]